MILRALLSRHFDEDGADTIMYLITFCALYCVYFVAIQWYIEHRKSNIIDFPEQGKKIKESR